VAPPATSRGHISGDERDSAPENLIWNCRACNTGLGIIFKRAGIGRRTRQFDPLEAEGAKSLGQWLTAVMSMKGETDAITVPAAVEMIRATPPEGRSQFAGEIWRRRRDRGTDKQVPF
jgi:hypothetical protein